MGWSRQNEFPLHLLCKWSLTLCYILICLSPHILGCEASVITPCFTRPENSDRKVVSSCQKARSSSFTGTEGRVWVKIMSLQLAGCFPLAGWTKLQSWTSLNLEKNLVHLTVFQVAKSVNRALLKARCTWRQINPQVSEINATRFHTATITILRLFICHAALFLLIVSCHKLNTTLMPARAFPLPRVSA